MAATRTFRRLFRCLLPDAIRLGSHARGADRARGESNHIRTQRRHCVDEQPHSRAHEQAAAAVWRGGDRRFVQQMMQSDESLDAMQPMRASRCSRRACTRCGRTSSQPLFSCGRCLRGPLAIRRTTAGRCWSSMCWCATGPGTRQAQVRHAAALMTPTTLKGASTADTDLLPASQLEVLKRLVGRQLARITEEACASVRGPGSLD